MSRGLTALPKPLSRVESKYWPMHPYTGRWENGSENYEEHGRPSPQVSRKMREETESRIILIREGKSKRSTMAVALAEKRVAV